MTNPDFASIDQWLQQHAPKITKQSLQAPATPADIQALESEIGKTLPDDFKALYLWHNGLTEEENVGSLFFAMDFFPIDRIITEYRERTENIGNPPLKAVDKGIDAIDSLNPFWLKFGFDGSHTALLLDLSPTSEGKYGQIIFVDDEYERGILVADSTAALVTDFAHALEQGLYQLNEDALEDGHHFLEADEKIDIVNWQTSEKWKR